MPGRGDHQSALLLPSQPRALRTGTRSPAGLRRSPSKWPNHWPVVTWKGPKEGWVWWYWRGVKISSTRWSSVLSRQGARDSERSGSMCTGQSRGSRLPPNYRAFSEKPASSAQPEPKLPAMPPGAAKVARVQ